MINICEESRICGMTKQSRFNSKPVPNKERDCFVTPILK